MSKGDRENMGTETAGCVLDLNLSDETHFVLRCLTVVGKSAANKCQSKNGTPATPCLCEHSREYAFWPNYSSNPLEVILMLPPLGIYIAGEARQATWLNCSREFTRPRFGHLEVFAKMIDEWPSLLAPGDKFLAEFPSRSSWLSHGLFSVCFPKRKIRDKPLTQLS
jgi:hypothetical protein